jgi:hypothetical protein
MMNPRLRLDQVWILCLLLSLLGAIGFLSACKKSEPAQKPATQAGHIGSEHAGQPLQSKTEVEPPAFRPQAINCANPTWPLDAIVAKYPPNAKPGFNSPEAVTALLEKRWSLADVRKFAIPERRHNNKYQNLVLDTPEAWAGRVYCDKATGFDSIEWYATVENGRATEYSLQAIRGKDFWLLEIGSPASVRKPPHVEPVFRAPYFVGHK